MNRIVRNTEADARRGDQSRWPDGKSAVTPWANDRPGLRGVKGSRIALRLWFSAWFTWGACGLASRSRNQAKLRIDGDRGSGRWSARERLRRAGGGGARMQTGGTMSRMSDWSGWEATDSNMSHSAWKL